MVAWLGTILIALMGLAAILYGLLVITVFVTHLIERRPVRPMKPAAADDPAWAKLQPIDSIRAASSAGEFNPFQAPGAGGDYASLRNSAAQGLGYAGQGLFTRMQGPPQKYYAALWLSSCRRVLAAVRWGTIGGLKANKTVLYSALENGRYIVTADGFTGAETPGLYDDSVLPDVDFDALVHRHEERLVESRQPVRQLHNEGLAEYEAILERRARFLVEQGDAYFVDGEESAIRSTLKGAFNGVGRLFQPTRYLDRKSAIVRRKAAARPAALPPALLWAERVCWIAMGVTVLISYQRPAVSLGQRLFRLTVLGVCLFGSLVIWILKMVYRQRVI
jgi:hypothetical protein